MKKENELYIKYTHKDFLIKIQETNLNSGVIELENTNLLSEEIIEGHLKEFLDCNVKLSINRQLTNNEIKVYNYKKVYSLLEINNNI